MNKKTKYWLWVGGIYAVLVIVFIILIVTFDWTLWVLFWVIIIPLVGLLAYWIITKISKPKPEPPKEKKLLDIESTQKYIRSFFKINDEVADEIESIEIKPYTPKQEGTEKESVNLAICIPYWNDQKVFLATHRDKYEVIAYKFYPLDDQEAEMKFEAEIDKAVLNPQRMVEVEEAQLDQSIPRVVRRKVPADYIKEAREKRLQKEAEAEEGVE